MKKVFMIILGILLFTFGCETKVEKFYLDDNLYSNGKLNEVTAEEYNKLENEKNNFAIYVYTPGCLSCAEFKLVLEEYIENTNMSFYMISTPEMKKTSISKYVTYGPSMVLVKEGQVVAYLDAMSNEDKPYYKSVEGLDEWLKKYVLMREEN